MIIQKKTTEIEAKKKLEYASKLIDKHFPEFNKKKKWNIKK